MHCGWFKAPFTVERLRAQRKEPLAQACSLKSTLHLSFQLESLNFLLGLQCSDGIGLDESHVEHLWQALGRNPGLPPWGSLRMSRARALILWAQSQMGFQAFFGLSQMLLCLVTLPTWYLTLSMLLCTCLDYWELEDWWSTQEFEL